MTEPTQDEKPAEKNDAKLRHEDLKRVCGIDDESCAPLICSDEDCFIPGSELNHHVPPTLPHPESE